MEFENIIRERKSTRKFSNKPIEKEKLDKIIEAGIIAPTAKIIQPVKIFVIQSKDDHSTYEIDSCIIATHMILEATNIGIDNIWIDMFDRNIIKEEFNMPKNLTPVCLVPLGYKSELCPPSMWHNKRKSVDELVEYR